MLLSQIMARLELENNWRFGHLVGVRFLEVLAYLLLLCNEDIGPVMPSSNILGDKLVSELQVTAIRVLCRDTLALTSPFSGTFIIKTLNTYRTPKTRIWSPTVAQNNESKFCL
ncbi:hypothetical protein Hanom_Chr08g00742861 [Helianthus anomalus]